MKNIFDNDAILARVKALLTSLAKAGGINLCVLDILGDPIVYPTNDCELCKRVRACPEGRAQCIKYASHAILECMREKRTYFYLCPFGLVDFVVPVFHEGEFLCAVCGGQVRCSEGAEGVDFAYPQMAVSVPGIDAAELEAVYDAMPDRPMEAIKENARVVEFFAGDITRLDTVVEVSRRDELNGIADRERLRPALTYIDKHYTTDISASEMAAMCHMSENYFSRMFGRVTGTTFPRYVTGLRIARAKELLLAGGSKVRAVAYDVGYDDPAYFVRRFKQCTGMTPAEWQKFGRAEREALRDADTSERS